MSNIDTQKVLCFPFLRRLLTWAVRKMLHAIRFDPIRRDITTKAPEGKRMIRIRRILRGLECCAAGHDNAARQHLPKANKIIERAIVTAQKKHVKDFNKNFASLGKHVNVGTLHMEIATSR